MSPRRPALVVCCALAVGALVVGALVLGAGLAAPRREPVQPVPVPVPVGSVRPVGATVDAIEVLRAWDARRAQAWAAGDPRALRRLYTPGSRTGRRDAAGLAAYAGRGLRVTGVRHQLLAVDVLALTGRRMTLQVTDRLSRAVARGPGGAVELPRDRPSTWRVRLCRVAGEWRVAEVRPARTPARR